MSEEVRSLGEALSAYCGGLIEALQTLQKWIEYGSSLDPEMGDRIFRLVARDLALCLDKAAHDWPLRDSDRFVLVDPVPPLSQVGSTTVSARSSSGNEGSARGAECAEPGPGSSAHARAMRALQKRLKDSKAP